jgi:hypothetical protein
MGDRAGYLEFIAGDFEGEARILQMGSLKPSQGFRKIQILSYSTTLLLSSALVADAGGVISEIGWKRPSRQAWI